MIRSFNVGMADDDPATREVLQRMLEALGHRVAFVAETGRELVSNCIALRPDLVLTDIRMPDMDGLDATNQILEKAPTAVIVLSGHCDGELVGRAEKERVLAYLVKPVTQQQLEAAIAMATHRYQECRSLEREAAELRQALADRKLLERAKGLLMKHLGVDDQEAARRLQTLAANKNKTQTETAEAILKAVEMLTVSTDGSNHKAKRAAPSNRRVAPGRTVQRRA